MKMSHYFMLTLDEYAAASFTSFSKPYFGTAEQIDAFFQAIREDKETASSLEYLLEIYDRYKAGETNIKHVVAYQKVPFLTPVQEVLGEARAVVVNHHWDHLNIWECPYHMRCDQAESKHLWLMCEDRCYRVIAAHFSNLCYKDSLHKNQYVTPYGSPWGFPHQFVLSPDISYNRLFVVEEIFASKEAAREDYVKFCNHPTPVFDRVLDDLFGDG